MHLFDKVQQALALGARLGNNVHAIDPQFPVFRCAQCAMKDRPALRYIDGRTAEHGPGGLLQAPVSGQSQKPLQTTLGEVIFRNIQIKPRSFTREATHAMRLLGKQG